MSIVIDNKKGTKVGQLLYHSFATVGIHGHKDMPEDVIPTGVKRGSLEHVLFITLTVSIDYQRDAPSLWKVSRQTFQDPETRYLFDPGQLHQITFQKIAKDMQKYKLSKKPHKDANIWPTVGLTFHNKWKDDPLWHLSKYGCTKRNDISGFCPFRQRCEAKEYCVEGKIRIGNGPVELET